MALWTPYAEDAALDLSTKCKNPTLTSDYYPNNVVYGYPYPVTEPHPYYGYPADTYVPAPRSSPLSGDSMCSYATPVSPRTGMISPPASPTSRHATRAGGKRSSYMDADSLSDDPDFQEFEKDTLRAMAEKNGGSLLGNNPRMRRAVQGSAAADDSYRRQRERNNHAAKQSRDRRKLREIHLALKVTFLRNELAKLRGQLASNSCVRCRQPYPY
ncbi:PREDICTED: D site-binding protein-like [Papilio xuthus]|uniref:D site-binding protein-like n=1 Tax=Papilio xuthus TaxID=66420 RepID=A0AAJ6YZE9_PAPXU|nr:PREDICTED: D site-binding protein-like [Papilio xuthus]